MHQQSVENLRLAKANHKELKLEYQSIREKHTNNNISNKNPKLHKKEKKRRLNRKVHNGFLVREK